MTGKEPRSFERPTCKLAIMWNELSRLPGKKSFMPVLTESLRHPGETRRNQEAHFLGYSIPKRDGKNIF